VNDAQNVRVDRACRKDHDQQNLSKMIIRYHNVFRTKSLQTSKDTNNPVYKFTIDNLQLVLINVLVRSISEH